MENADRLKHLKENPGELESTEPADLHPHFLPYKTIGEEGVLLAVVLDDLCIHTPREVIHVANPVLALAVEPSALGKECGCKSAGSVLSSSPGFSLRCFSLSAFS